MAFYSQTEVKGELEQMFGRWIRLVRHYFGHLKWKLFICFVFISVIPAIITGYFLYDRSYEAIEEKISVYSQQIMVQSAGRLDTLLTGIEDISLQMVSSTDIQALIKQIAYTKDSESEALGITALKQRLLQPFPSWMYSIKHGATTIWERWDGWMNGAAGESIAAAGHDAGHKEDGCSLFQLGSGRYLFESK